MWRAFKFRHNFTISSVFSLKHLRCRSCAKVFCQIPEGSDCFGCVIPRVCPPPPPSSQILGLTYTWWHGRSLLSFSSLQHTEGANSGTKWHLFSMRVKRSFQARLQSANSDWNLTWGHKNPSCPTTSAMGGTSVFFHIARGCIFYTDRKYKKHSSLKLSTIFHRMILMMCVLCLSLNIKSNQTMMITLKADWDCI